MRLVFMMAMDAQVDRPRSDSVAKIHEALDAFDTVMLSSAGHARPMHVAKVEDDCSLWFITSQTSAKADTNAEVLGQTGTRHIAMPGTLEVVRDRTKLEALWSKAYEVWFPEGPSDPDAVLLRFTPKSAELWDSSGSKGLKYLFQSVKALITGDTPDVDADQHTKTQIN